MSKITIVDLEVFCCVGVTEEERAKPQRLLLTVEMSFDFSSASVSDRIEKTINYQKVAEDLLSYGEGRSWKLLEKLAANVADMVLTRIQAAGGDGGGEEIFDSASALRLGQLDRTEAGGRHEVRMQPRSDAWMRPKVVSRGNR